VTTSDVPRPSWDLLEPSKLPVLERRDTEPCREEPSEPPPTERPSLAELAADADRRRMVREAGQEAAGIISGTLMQILEGQRQADAKLDLLLGHSERIAQLEARIERLERRCSECPLAAEPVQ
jgi:hypothetical protein